MALIEHLEQDNWEEFLRDSFEYVLDILRNDRFRSVGSSADDLRSWLTCGGISRVKDRLNYQMDVRRFSSERKRAVSAFLERLVERNRRKLLDLMTEGIVASTKEEWLAACGVSGVQFQDLLGRILAGERPFEDWMRAHGRSDEEIAEIYRIVDRWLIEKGMIPPPLSAPDLN